MSGQLPCAKSGVVQRTKVDQVCWLDRFFKPQVHAQQACHFCSTRHRHEQDPPGLCAGKGASFTHICSAFRVGFSWRAVLWAQGCPFADFIFAIMEHDRTLHLVRQSCRICSNALCQGSMLLIPRYCSALRTHHTWWKEGQFLSLTPQHRHARRWEAPWKCLNRASPTGVLQGNINCAIPCKTRK